MRVWMGDGESKNSKLGNYHHEVYRTDAGYEWSVRYDRSPDGRFPERYWTGVEPSATAASDRRNQIITSEMAMRMAGE